MKQINKYIDKLFSEKTVNNLAIRVGKNDKILYESYRSTNQSINDKTLFDMASVTKIVVTATLTHIALDKGLLSLEQNVSDFFDCSEDYKDLKIRHLLTHTMGIGHKPLNIEGNTYENIEKYILNIPADAPVGTIGLYSSAAFIILGKILERVFGASLDIIFKQYVATPLDMKSSCFSPEERINIVNSNLEPEKLGLVNDYNSQFLSEVAGHAGLFSNIEDITKFVTMLLSEGSPLFSAETFSNLIKLHSGNPRESWCLGFVYVDEKYAQTGKLFETGSIGHCGHTGQSVFVDLESGLYVIILSDATISTVKKYGHEIYTEVMQMRTDIHNSIKQDLYL
ncbi:MAG: beta-lactamase family protein [Clostridia bacterium]|nr:beta-lactamase family protein [Clostridia bacterium]